MPEPLRSRYGGPLEIPLRTDRPSVIANFVTTLDGIVAFGQGDLAGGGLVSGNFEPDRFVMALLRAVADVVVIGAGTLRGSSRQRWVAEHVDPADADLFRDWRRSMGLAAHPTTVVVTASGSIPLDHPGLNDAAIPVVVATTAAGAARISTATRSHRSVEVLGDGERVRPDEIVGLTRKLGARLVLTEGGPHLLGELVEADLLDELFLTLAPQLAGRADERRLGLVEGLALPPGRTRWEELRSAKRAGDHLFLRYARRSREH
jgi:riboflavin biosynthesis pyrimidine reductase